MVISFIKETTRAAFAVCFSLRLRIHSFDFINILYASAWTGFQVFFFNREAIIY